MPIHMTVDIHKTLGEIKKRGYPPGTATAGVTMLEIIDLGKTALDQAPGPPAIGRKKATTSP